MKFFSLIYQGDVHASSDDKIIPAEEFSTLMEASEILEKAREDAAAYRKEEEEVCAELRKKAEKEGFAEGLAQFNDQILFFEQELKKIRHEAHKLILPIAIKAAKKIVGKELETHPETIVDIVLQALSPVTQNLKIAIYVNKADREALEAERSRIKAILEQAQSVSIHERSDIAPGGCIIETEKGIINATIENQWRALEAAFEKYMKPGV